MNHENQNQTRIDHSPSDSWWISSPADFDGDLEGHPLADWTGAFAPAPVDWDDRPPFSSSRYSERVNSWRASLNVDSQEIFIGSHLSSPPATEETVDSKNKPLASQKAFKVGMSNCSTETCKLGSGVHYYCTVTGDIAPHNWIPSDIDGISAKAWWARHKREPSTDSDAQPFWDRYLEGFVLKEPQVPNIKVDASENDMNKVRNQTAAHSMTTFDIRQIKSSDARQIRENKARIAKLPRYLYSSDNPNAPKIDVYLRPAERRDMGQITEIFNYFVEKTVCSPEPFPISLRSMIDRWQDVVRTKLPFIVAASETKITRQVNARTVREEQIMGFAFADEYHDSSGMYRYAVDIETFVSQPGHRLGVGRCLLDMLLSILDPYWIKRGGYKFIGDPVSYAPGGQRVVGSIIVSVPYGNNDKSRAEWIENWLSGFGFKKVGEFEEIGRKLNTVVNQAVFLKQTGNKIEAWATAT